MKEAIKVLATVKVRHKTLMNMMDKFEASEVNSEEETRAALSVVGAATRYGRSAQILIQTLMDELETAEKIIGIYKVPGYEPVITEQVKAEWKEMLAQEQY